MSNTPRPIVIAIGAKSVRSFGFGVISVALALDLAARGLSPLLVGATLSIALLAGAASLGLAALLLRRFGVRASLVLSATLLAASGGLLALRHSTIALSLACVSGTLSAGGQEVGAFTAVEQLVIAELVPAVAVARSLAIYNLAGAFALAVGALAAAIIATTAIGIVYAVCGVVLAALYLGLPRIKLPASSSMQPSKSRGFGPGERLAALFGLDALAGGFVVQSFLSYWLHLRYGVDQHLLGVLLFGANTLAAFSYLVAAWLSTRIGLIRTMVFTHLPSNVLLAVVPFMPTFTAAAAVLLARFALSQMDVPTRQAFTFRAVPAEDRARVAGLTNAVRPAAAAIAPIFAGLAVQTAAMGVPFFLAGGLKIVYDLAVLKAFGAVERQD